jgi:hypothetical protein
MDLFPTTINKGLHELAWSSWDVVGYKKVMKQRGYGWEAGDLNSTSIAMRCSTSDPLSTSAIMNGYE